MSQKTKWFLVVVIGMLLISTGGILWYRYSESGKRNADDEEQMLPAIKIILTNGCGFENLAKEFSGFLKKKNVDIVSMGNTIRPVYDKTIIVIRKGDSEDLKRLQRMTGIVRYTEARNEIALADFEIIIGKDYEHYVK